MSKELDIVKKFAYNEGWKAQTLGQGGDFNPYPQGTLGSGLWWDGWWDAKRDWEAS